MFLFHTEHIPFTNPKEIWKFETKKTVEEKEDSIDSLKHEQKLTHESKAVVTSVYTPPMNLGSGQSSEQLRTKTSNLSLQSLSL